MREHQIVISLKPEQFQEVQKQARAAGAQSVGAFVRQNLLVFLGLEEAESTRKGSQMAPSVQADPDWRFIAGELRRLHRELKVLSSEAAISNTLVTDIVGATSGGPLLASTVGLSEPYSEPVSDPKPTAVQENFLTAGAPVTADDFPDALEDSLILPPAHGITGGGTTPFFSNPTLPGRSSFGLPMTAGQLPLGSPFSHHTFMPNISPLPSELGMTAKTPARQEFTVDEGDVVETTKIEARPPEPQSLAQPAVQEADSPAGLAAVQTATEAQTTSLSAAETNSQDAPQAAQPVSPPVSSEPAMPPQPSEQNESAPFIPAPTRQQTTPQPAAQHPGAFAPQKDDMEVLADRAFAISPRLGAIEPEVTLQPAPTRSFADTLEELLDAGLINQVLSQSEDDGSNQYAGDVEAPPEDDLVQVIVQEVEIPSADETDSGRVKESDNVDDTAGEEEPEPPKVVQHEPPPPPRPIGGDDTSNEDEPPKPPPRRRKLM